MSETPRFVRHKVQIQSNPMLWTWGKYVSPSGEFIATFRGPFIFITYWWTP